MTINTALMFPLQPNWQGPTMDSTVERIGVMVDNKVGVAKSRTNSILPNYRKRYEFILTGTEPETIRTWIETYMQGRWKGFWIPTWISDFTLAAPVGSGDGTFTVQGLNRHGHWDFDNGRRTIVAILPNGTQAYANIVNITGTGYGTETVTILSAFGTALPIGTLICWLLYGRCDQDDLEIEWQGGFETATFGFDFIELPWEQNEMIT